MVFVLRDEPHLLESEEVGVNSRLTDFTKNALKDFDVYKGQVMLPGLEAAIVCKFEIKPASVSVENGMVYLRQWKGQLSIPSFNDRCNVAAEVQKIFGHLYEKGYQVSISSWGKDDMAFDMQIPLDQFEAIANGI